MSNPFSFPRGEAIIIDLVIADPGSYDPSFLLVNMSLKVTYNLQPPPVTVSPIATFTVTYYPSVNGNPAYWEGVIDAATCAALTPGSYITDAEILFGNSVVAVTSPQIINIASSVTPAA